MSRNLAGALAFALAAACGVAGAQTFRWSNQGNFLTTDPHAQNTVITNQINAQVYDRLLMRGKQLEIVPALAESWTRTGPTAWVFRLRKGVKWHDGSDFTAEDVVFSVRRAQATTSSFRTFGQMLGTPRAIDPHTVEFTTPAPNPVLPDAAVAIAIMSKAWCLKHGVEKPQDYSRKEETYASRNAMGTGPFTLVSHEPDVKSVFRKNPNWWGLKEGLFEGNVKEVVFTPIASDPTRMAALASGSVDFVLDPPPQDVERLRRDKAIRMIDGPEASIFFLGMDQHHDELSYGSVKGANPFKDVRVRRAMSLAIDMDAVVRTALRGHGVPTSIFLAIPARSGLVADDVRRPPADLAIAGKLMAEAGYAGGFTVTMDCDARNEKVCTAVAGMLSKIGITLNLSVKQASQYYQKIKAFDTSFFLAGWVSALDPIFILQPLVHSRNDKGDGEWTLGRFKDAKIDSLIDELKMEFDEPRRGAIVREVARLVRDNVYVIPLYRRTAPWAARSNIEVVHRPDVWLETRWVQVR
jgi:peptide/nickel transport system substrate-binding protein